MNHDQNADLQLFAVASDSALMRRVEAMGLDHDGVPCQEVQGMHRHCQAFWAQWQPPSAQAVAPSAQDQWETSAFAAAPPQEFQLQMSQSGIDFGHFVNSMVDADEATTQAMVWGATTMGSNVSFTSSKDAAKFGQLFNAVDWSGAEIAEDANAEFLRSTPSALGAFYARAAEQGLGVLAARLNP